ncbi:hypothetical protein FHU41_001268 [Psychromicrobium silvestre]|uniref:Uncharacterized protein n=1 Tax=Psychromicrobium silvestre TaxID=1645614 RepID=A0A7Y9S840_9MICC|nr:hypothetical protein [Psychromicrobium silvestre]NYE95047.1 hypothetical protein [Psychromicrobium silvestre]
MFLLFALLAIAARLSGRIVYAVTVMPVGMTVGGILELREGPKAVTLDQAMGSEFTTVSKIVGGILIPTTTQLVPVCLLWWNLQLRWLAVAWFLGSVALIAVLVVVNKRSVSRARREYFAAETNALGER